MDQHPYAPFIHDVSKPARYLGGEYHCAGKAWDDVSMHVALAFPDAYEIGMSHLGLRILYRLLNDDPEISAERAYAPWVDMEEKLREHNVPLVSTESARPLADFDVIGFSLQYELTFTNVLNMLDLAGLPLRAEERTNEHPLVVAGGPVAFQPEPLAPFVDGFVIGDGEFFFARLVHNYVRLRGLGLNREDILIRLAKLGGIYCPSLYETEVGDATGHVVVGKPKYFGVPEKIERKIINNINLYPYPQEVPVPSTEIVFDRFSMEIARGCFEGCRFCQAGNIYRPVRERDPDQIIDTMTAAVQKGGYDEASLTSLSTADFSCVSPLVKKLMGRLKDEKVSLSVSSLRAYGLSEDLLDCISDVRNTSLTFAPEAGTQRMRDVVNKNISEVDMEKAAHAVFSKGWKRCKLYFMIGLPSEEEDDYLGIVRTAKMYLSIARRYHSKRGCEILTSVSSHVPKPHTPFQWARMDDINEIRAKQEAMLNEVKGTPGVRLKWHDACISHIEGILSRGDRRIADWIEYAFRNGCRFDGWDDQLRFDVWMEGLEELGIDKGIFLNTIPVDARLPWDHLDIGLDSGFLVKEYRRALEGRFSPPCAKPFRAKVHHTNLMDATAEKRKLVCYDCGIKCDLTQMRDERLQFLTRLGATERPPEPPLAYDLRDDEERLREIRARNRRPRTAIANNANALRYRFVYEKQGAASFISHLDLVRLLPRIFRRAELPMTYTLGFHPKPRITFSPALPLGWRSRGEIIDLSLEEEVSPARALERLNRSAPDGLRFTSARRLENDDRGISRVIRLAEYGVRWEEGWDRERVAERMARIDRGEPVEVIKQKKGEAVAAEVSGAIVRAELDGDSNLRLLLRLNASPNVRPDQLTEWLTGVECSPANVERLALWAESETQGTVSPMDIEGLRVAVRNPGYEQVSL